MRSPDEAAPRRPKLTQLMTGLARLSLISFGGVAPQARHFFVAQTGWLDDDEFAELLSLGQALPGANIVNLVTMLGDRWYGPLGTIAALAALLLPPTALMLAVATVLQRVPQTPRLTQIESAVLFACAGLVLSNGVRVLQSMASRRSANTILAAAVAIAVALAPAWMPAITVAGLAAGFALNRSQRSVA